MEARLWSGFHCSFEREKYVDYRNRLRLAVGYVGENGIKANTWYRVWNFDTGELEEVPAAECPT